MKSRYDNLDGLRGVAALSVFIFHFLEMIHSPDDNIICYTYLAVDFFFVLSGFVLGYAYDNRLSGQAPSAQQIDSKRFFALRLIRLHPLVVIGATLGLAEYLCDPFAGNAQRNAMLSLVALNFGLALFNLPAPSLPGCYVVTHSLNSPSWSLTQEYLANIFYGFFGRKLTRAWLGAIWLVCAAGTLWAARHYHDLSLGWGWPTLLPGLIRTLVSFCAGLLVYRLNLRLNLPWAFPVLSLALLCIFAAPYSIMKNWGGMYDALCVLAFFPVMVAAGAGSRDSAGLAGRVCRVLGRLSYPLYILHYPFVSFFLHWTKAAHPTPQTMYGVMGLTVAGVVVFAWLLLRYFDEPLRLRLGSKLNACTGR